MPRSSGGGSHGGGSHSSSHSSRSRSGGGRSGPSRIVRNTYFPGARRYVVYNRRKHVPVYYYSNYAIGGKSSRWRLLLLFFYFPFFAIIFALLAESFVRPTRIEDDCSYQYPMVYDMANVIEDSDELYDCLEDFADTTGIVPYVVTINNEDWKDYSEYYSDFEDIAYDMYVNALFGYDENHWLLLYSEPRNPDPDFNDWYWEGMQGDYTVDILTDSKTGTFTKLVQKRLLAGDDFGEAVTAGFEAITPGIMDPYVDFAILFTCGFMALFIGFHCYMMVFFDPNKKFRGAVELAPEQQIEVSCDYCAGKYVSGSVDKCPYCGAPAKIAHVDPATMPNLNTYVYSNNTPDKLASSNGGYTSEYDEIFKDQFHETKLN